VKIALIHYRLVRSGGLERRLITYATHLASAGHEVHVVTGKQSADVDLPATVRVHVLSPGLTPHPYRRRYFDWRVGRFMRERQFDLSVSLMRTSHQDVVLCPGTHLGYLAADDREQVRADRQAFDRSKAILAASDMTREELIALYQVEPQKVHTLRPPVDADTFRPDHKKRQKLLREKHQLPLDKRIFLFVSNSHDRKGLPLLLDVFSQLRSNDTVLAIAGPPVRSGLDNVVDLHFSTNMEELYAAADFTIHPAAYEPFGQIVPESLCSNTPVLISDRVGAKEVVGDGEGLVIDLTDTHRWRAAVESASAEAFDIAPDFANRADLTISGHVACLLEIGRTVTA